MTVEHYNILAKYPPSKVAIACFYLARKCCQLKNVWSEDLEEYTNYTEIELGDILADLRMCKEIHELIRFALNNFKDGSPRPWKIQKNSNVK